jgi:hypothetical protein
VSLPNTTNTFVRGKRQIILKKTNKHARTASFIYASLGKRLKGILVQTYEKVSEPRNGIQRILAVRWNRTRRKKNFI